MEEWRQISGIMDCDHSALIILQRMTSDEVERCLRIEYDIQSVPGVFIFKVFHFVSVSFCRLFLLAHSSVDHQFCVGLYAFWTCEKRKGCVKSFARSNNQITFTKDALVHFLWDGLGRSRVMHFLDSRTIGTQSAHTGRNRPTKSNDGTRSGYSQRDLYHCFGFRRRGGRGPKWERVQSRITKNHFRKPELNNVSDFFESKFFSCKECQIQNKTNGFAHTKFNIETLAFSCFDTKFCVGKAVCFILYLTFLARKKFTFKEVWNVV